MSAATPSPRAHERACYPVRAIPPRPDARSAQGGPCVNSSPPGANLRNRPRRARGSADPGGRLGWAAPKYGRPHTRGRAGRSRGRAIGFGPGSRQGTRLLRAAASARSGALAPSRTDAALLYSLAGLQLATQSQTAGTQSARQGVGDLRATPTQSRPQYASTAASRASSTQLQAVGPARGQQGLTGVLGKMTTRDRIPGSPLRQHKG